MKILAHCKQGARALGRFRRRTLFMVTGITVGIAALTLMDSIGENTRRETMKRVRNMLGTFDTLLIRPGGTSRGMVTLANVDPTLKFTDGEAIVRSVSSVEQAALVQNAFDVDAGYRDKQTTPAVFGVSANWTSLRGDEMQLGSFFTAEDERRLSRVAVLGEDVRRTLFGSEDPLGKTIRVGGVPFDVVGVLAVRGAGPAGGSLDNVILIPVTTASRRLFNRDFLTMIVAQLKDPQASSQAVWAIRGLLRERHHLASTALDDFSITDPKAVYDRMVSVGSTLALILRGVAVLAMLAGGVVILCMTISGVVERRREIGLRRSAGATRGDILFQFLFEALLVGAAGGAIGTALAASAVAVVAFWQKLPLEFNAGVAAAGLALACAAGVVFGVYPAWKASRLDPVAALRD